MPERGLYGGLLQGLFDYIEGNGDSGFQKLWALSGSSPSEAYRISGSGKKSPCSWTLWGFGFKRLRIGVMV